MGNLPPIPSDEIPKQWTFGRFSAGLYARNIRTSDFMQSMYRWISEEIHAFLEMHGLNQKLLDIGTGPGELPLTIAHYLSDLNYTGHLHGLDVSKAMVRYAQSSAEEFNYPYLTFVQGSVCKLPYGDDQFDLVFSSFSANQWPCPEKAIHEMVRVVKPGKEIWLYDINLDLSRSDWRKARKEFGLFTTWLVLRPLRRYAKNNWPTYLKILTEHYPHLTVTAEAHGIATKYRIHP